MAWVKKIFETFEFAKTKVPITGTNVRMKRIKRYQKVSREAKEVINNGL